MRSFKKILKTLGIFLLAVCLLSGCFAALYFESECYSYQDANERDALSGSVTLVGCGASFMLFGFRPDVFDAGYEGVSYNLSGIRLTMNGRYELLRKELERNPIRTVLLEISADTLTRSREEEGVEGDLRLLGRMRGWEALRYFFRNFSLSEYPAVYYDVVSRGMDNLLTLLEGDFQVNNEYEIRGYSPNVQAGLYLSSWFHNYYHTESLDETVRQEDVEGLRKIAALCREHGAELILVDFPKTELYNCKYDNHQFFHNWYAAFAAEEGIAYYDFNLYRWKWALVPDQDCFGDETHMVDSGAQRFTSFLAEFLTRRDRGEELSGDFFVDYRHRDQEFTYIPKDSIGRSRKDKKAISERRK